MARTPLPRFATPNSTCCTPKTFTAVPSIGEPSSFTSAHEQNREELLQKISQIFETLPQKFALSCVSRCWRSRERETASSRYARQMGSTTLLSGEGGIGGPFSLSTASHPTRSTRARSWEASCLSFRSRPGLIPVITTFSSPAHHNRSVESCFSPTSDAPF